jgi:hypothetical protein
MPDVNRSLPESILALIAGRDRATAIYGDLLELAATRPRTSFWIGYFRTLMSLSWRPLTAFLTAAIVCAMLYDSQGFGLWICAVAFPHLGPPLADVILLLWFLVPFAAIRYGFRDRPVQLAFAASAVSTSGLFLALWSSPSEVWMVLTLLAALCIAASAPWRRSLVPVAASCAFGTALMEGLDRVGYFNRAIEIPGLQRLSPVLPLLSVMLIVSVLFSWLHRRLPRHQLAGGSHA